MKNNFILEIGCEEIPARFMPEILENIKKTASEKFSQNRLPFEMLESIGTPRRITLYLKGLIDKQEDITEEIKGPPSDISFDKNNNPTPAALGFAQKNGINVGNLIKKQDGNREYLYAKIFKKGQKTEILLKKLVPEIIGSLYLPVSMKWGNETFKFIRPIHWIVALYGKKPVKFRLAGIESSNKTRGHRFSKKKQISLLSSNIEEYKKKLKDSGVIVDNNIRKEMIKSQVLKISKNALIDESLVNEVNFLVEYPYAIKCSFNESFLDLPKEVLVTTMKKNQKYFPILSDKGSLTKDFIVITNNCKNKGIRHGNEKVITARLSDAKFFFDEDKKLPLRARIKDLENVQFLEGLGNMLQKTERLWKLSEYIAKELKLEEKYGKEIKATAELAKADLLTQMVFEFPELQGTMGKIYASISMEDKISSEGIFEHYLPRFAGDILPKTVPGTIVSLADKFDLIVGCFSIGKIPTGSVDPYGLRRAAFGIIKIITANKLELLLDEIVAYSLKSYSDIIKTADFEKTYKQISDFISGRYKGLLLEESIPHDVIDASFANIADLLFSGEIARILSKVKNEAWLKEIVKTHDRIFKISSSAKRDEIIEQDLIEDSEKNLFDSYLKVNWSAEEKVKQGNYLDAIKEFSKLTTAVNEFFEKTLVMHQDERIKTNRLALLKSINNAFLKVCDFKKIVI